MTIPRRTLLGGAVAAGLSVAARAMLPPPDGDRLKFNIMRKGDVIGTHQLDFARLDNGIDIRIAVDIAVGIGPLVLFRYELHGLEQWRNGVVVHMDATTNDDGTPDHIRADRDERGLWVEGSKASRYLAPLDALPATHWNVAELEGPWINPQDGRLFHPTVQRTGSGRVALADGRQEQATNFRVSGDVQMELWYNEISQWVSLMFTAKDGSLIQYQKT